MKKGLQLQVCAGGHDLPSSATDPLGLQIRAAYADGQLAALSYPFKEAFVTNTFACRANGQPVSAANEYGEVTWSYDAAGVAVSESQGGFTVVYDYDESGNVTSAVSVAGTTTVSLDDLDRLTELRSPAGDFGWRYSATNGLVSEVAYPNGIVASYAFDVTDRLLGITYRNPTDGVVRSMGYSYNNLDLITRVEQEDGSSRDYGYDELDQLASEEQRDASNVLTYVHTLGYDLAGNRTQTVCNAQTNVWTRGQGNRLASWGPGTAAEYDAAGCTTSLVYAGGTRLDLTWNDRYQLLNVRKDGVEVESYTYDALGRRLTTSNAAGVVRHVFDGPHVIADVDADGRPLRTYAYGPGIDNVLSMTVHGATTNAYYYLKDHLGSVLALTDDAGTVVESYEYDAWGQASVYDASGAPLAESAFGNRYGFQSREQSWATGLIHFRARWYDTVTGRWLSNDPIGISGGLNQYVFCGNRPVIFRDPLGLCENRSGWVAAGLLSTMFPWSGSSQMNYLWGQIQSATAWMRNFPVGSQAWQGVYGHTQGLYARLAATAGATYTAAGHITGYGALGLTGAGSSLSVGAIGGLAIVSAGVGGGVEYGVSQIPAGPNGQTVGEFWGGVFFDAAPGFWIWIAD